MRLVNGGCWGRTQAGIKPLRDILRGGPCDLRDHRAVYRYEGPELRRGLPGRLHLRCRRPLHDQPRGVHRLRRLRARVPRRSHLPRGRSPRRHGELHDQGRQLLRVDKAQGNVREGPLGPSFFYRSDLPSILPRMEENSWRTLGRDYLYESPWCAFRVDDVELPGGTRIEYGVLESGGVFAPVPPPQAGGGGGGRPGGPPVGALPLELA